MEVLKFSIYLVVPAFTTIYCTNPDFMQVSSIILLRML